MASPKSWNKVATDRLVEIMVAPEEEWSIERCLREWRLAQRRKREPGERFRAEHGIRLRKIKRRASPFRGVTWNSRGYGWNVRTKVRGRSIDLGFFLDGLERQAAAVYDLACVIRFGDAATLNFPDEIEVYRREIEEGVPPWFAAMVRGEPWTFACRETEADGIKYQKRDRLRHPFNETLERVPAKESAHDGLREVEGGPG